MVRLYEFQGKQLLKNTGVLVPKGKVASTPDEAKSVAEEIGAPVAVNMDCHAHRQKSVIM